MGPPCTLRSSGNLLPVPLSAVLQKCKANVNIVLAGSVKISLLVYDQFIRASKHVFIKMPLKNYPSVLKEYIGSYGV